MKGNLAPLIAWLEGRRLPGDYEEYVDGLSEGALVNDIVLIYSADEIVERNETFEVKRYCPGHLSIGDDSGGSAIVMTLATGAIGIVDHGSMKPADIHPLAKSFAEWKDSGFSTEYEHVAKQKYPPGY